MGVVEVALIATGTERRKSRDRMCQTVVGGTEVSSPFVRCAICQAHANMHLVGLWVTVFDRDQGAGCT